MSDLQYALALTGLVAIYCLVIAVMEWFDREPKDWVVKVRMWWNKDRKP